MMADTRIGVCHRKISVDKVRMDCTKTKFYAHRNQFLNDGINSTPQATAVTGRQRSESAGRFRQVFPKKSEN